MVGCSDDGGGNRNPIAPTSPVAQQAGPDLVVASPSVSDSGPAAGAQFTLTVTVRNDGNVASAATTLRYYQSTDGAITESDTAVGTAAVAGLSASGTLSESVQLTAPSAPGTYYYGACVDAVTGESDTTNNCSASVRVDVPDPGPGPGPEPEPEPEPESSNPDLVVGLPSVSNSRPAAEAPFTLSATVRNAGDGASPATTLRYYRSTDRAITATDMQVGTAAVAGLSASGSRSESVELTAPSTPGTYYYGACVDAVAEESDTTNNCSASVEVAVPEPTNPDLAVTSLSVSDSGPVVEAQFTLSATVRNGGDGASTATTLRFYRSTDRAITATDTQVGTAALAGLSASGSRSVSVDLTAPSTPGTYYYGACVDAVADESDTMNNCSASMEVNVLEMLEPTQGSPDLVVASPSVSDSGPGAGETFTLSATVSNAGDGESVATTLRYYQSVDGTITTSDAAVGTDAVAVLGASGSSGESVDLTAPSSPGTYYYGACVDSVADESDTTNNCSTSVPVTVPEPERHADLVVRSPAVDDDSPETGGPFTLSATVTNAGDGESAATTLRYYRLTDATVTTSDTQVGTDAVGPLSASGTSEESIDLTAPSTADTYYYGACVDAVTGESSATNNCSSSVQVDVTEPPPPSNRSPEAVGQIASRTLEAGGSETLDVSSRFSDPDNDELAYAAASSDTSVATAAASGSAVTVTAVASGEAVVTVTASDPGGLTAEQGIAVTVAAGNRPPIATETIPDQTIHVWGELQILPSSRNRFIVRGIHNYFSDPDGDPLQYEASSSDERYATVRTSIIPALDHYQMIVDPVAVGQATITLAATDPEGLNANYVFGVNVSPPIPNRRPVVQWPIGARQVYVGVPDLLRFRDHFRDEDNYGSYFQLNYAVSSADNRIALVRVWDKRDHETGHGYARLVIEGVSAGETTATVVATDRAGLSVEHTFNVIARTRPPRVTRRISDVLVSAGVETYVWDLNGYFTDPDGHDLVYGASSSDTTVVRATISRDGQYVVLRTGEVGTADIAVTATDVTGLTASQTFTVTVVSPRPPTITRRISDRSVSVGRETYVYGLQNYFADPEGGELVYDASSADTSVVRASVGEDGPYVVLFAREVGTADITVTATDVTGLTASQTFTVTVTATLPVD